MTNLTAARNNPAVYTELTKKANFPKEAWDNTEAYRMRQDLVNAGVAPDANYVGAYVEV